MSHGDCVDAKTRARFWSKVNKHGPLMPGMKTRCWVWTAHRTKKGYGKFNVNYHNNGKIWQAHRFARYLATGVIPKLCVLHHCDNPPCVRNDHFFDGINDDNNKDCAAKGRARKSLGEFNPNSKLTEANVKSIKELPVNDKAARVALARKLKCTQAHILRIMNGKLWRHTVGP